MCKETPVIPVNRVVDPKRIISKWRAKEEEMHKGSLTPKKSHDRFERTTYNAQIYSDFI
jgi:hypothetical protein